MNRFDATRKVVAVAAASAMLVALLPAVPAQAEGITVTRSCSDEDDSRCAVQVAPAAPAAVAVAGPSTGLGPAIELNLAVEQVADAGTAVHLTRTSGSSGASGGGAESAGAAVNGFAVSVGQAGSATATSGSARGDTATAQAGGSAATQNPPGSGSDPGSGSGQSPPSGGSTSGVNMITNVASIVQIVQVVARNNSNTTIAPVQLAEQCQQAAVSCSGNTTPGHP